MREKGGKVEQEGQNKKEKTRQVQEQKNDERREEKIRVKEDSLSERTKIKFKDEEEQRLGETRWLDPFVPLHLLQSRGLWTYQPKALGTSSPSYGDSGFSAMVYSHKFRPFLVTDSPALPRAPLHRTL